jgi:hypothetical protein
VRIGIFIVFGFGIAFLIALYVMVRLRAQTHENVDPGTEEPRRGPPH